MHNILHLHFIRIVNYIMGIFVSLVLIYDLIRLLILDVGNFLNYLLVDIDAL